MGRLKRKRPAATDEANPHPKCGDVIVGCEADALVEDQGDSINCPAACGMRSTVSSFKGMTDATPWLITSAEHPMNSSGLKARIEMKAEA